MLSTITNQTPSHASHLKTECSGLEVLGVAPDLLVRTDTSKQLSRPSRTPLYNLHHEQLVCACLWFYCPSLRWLGKLRQAVKQDRRHYQNDKGVKKNLVQRRRMALLPAKVQVVSPLTGATFSQMYRRIFQEEIQHGWIYLPPAINKKRLDADSRAQVSITSPRCLLFLDHFSTFLPCLILHFYG